MRRSLGLLSWAMADLQLAMQIATLSLCQSLCFDEALCHACRQLRNCIAALCNTDVRVDVGGDGSAASDGSYLMSLKTVLESPVCLPESSYDSQHATNCDDPQKSTVQHCFSVFREESASRFCLVYL